MNNTLTMQGIRPQSLERVTDPKLRDFINDCITPREKRPRARQLLKHAYFESIRESIRDHKCVHAARSGVDALAPAVSIPEVAFAELIPSSHQPPPGSVSRSSSTAAEAAELDSLKHHDGANGVASFHDPPRDGSHPHTSHPAHTRQGTVHTGQDATSAEHAAAQHPTASHPPALTQHRHDIDGPGRPPRPDHPTLRMDSQSSGGFGSQHGPGKGELPTMNGLKLHDQEHVGMMSPRSEAETGSVVSAGAFSAGMDAHFADASEMDLQTRPSGHLDGASDAGSLPGETAELSGTKEFRIRGHHSQQEGKLNLKLRILEHHRETPPLPPPPPPPTNARTRTHTHSGSRCKILNMNLFFHITAVDCKLAASLLLSPASSGGRACFPHMQLKNLGLSWRIHWGPAEIAGIRWHLQAAIRSLRVPV